MVFQLVVLDTLLRRLDTAFCGPYHAKYGGIRRLASVSLQKSRSIAMPVIS